MDPQTTFAKTCAEQIMCTRHIPGVRTEIEKAIMTFDEKVRPRIIHLVKQEIARIKMERNIDGATVVMMPSQSSQPSSSHPSSRPSQVKPAQAKPSIPPIPPKPSQQNTWPVTVTIQDIVYDSDDVDTDTDTDTEINTNEPTGYRILSGRDLGCTHEEEDIYNSLIK